MGKLHSLRRAIERDPSKWHDRGRIFSAYRTEDYPYMRWWNYRTGKYELTYIGQNTFFPVDGFIRGKYPYRRFVRKVLLELGAIEE